jgi:hypothetical protein
MKFECSTEINAPISEVVALFNNPDYYKEWQDGFVSYEPLRGTPRTAGAKAKINFVNSGHKIELTETIEEMNLPKEMIVFYEHKHGANTMITRFKELPGDHTLYVTGVGYMKTKGLMPKLMAMFSSGMMKKQNQKWVDQFKAFVEDKSRHN